ncbi:MAG: hypothetical protein HY915_11810, partial [Desulfovibrio sp.]|nr:hypothetical protein [Desulfovibrio sp.]
MNSSKWTSLHEFPHTHACSARSGQLDRRQTQTQRRQTESLIVTGKSGENSSLFSSPIVLMERMWSGQVEGHTGNEFIMQNCTSIGGTLAINTSRVIPIKIRDCTFDGTAV